MTRTDVTTRFVWPPLLATAILGIIAAFSVAVHQAIIAPSLAAAIFGQLLHPDDSGSHPVSIALSQIIGAFAGMAAVALAGAIHAPPLMGGFDYTAGRALGIALAALLASAAQAATGNRTPAGGATALVVAIGIESVTLGAAGRMLAGIALATLLGEAARRWLLARRAAGDAQAAPP